MLLERLPVRRLSTWVIVYMILAFGWWSLHLWRQNDYLRQNNHQLLEYKFKADKGMNQTRFEQTAEFQKIEKTWQSGRRMIISEGLFFIGCLIFGLWVINRSALREVELARQRRNFLLSITHELKSPIASMRLSLETLVRRSLTPEQIRAVCEGGLRDANRLQNLVEDLLLAARLEDQWKPLTEPIDLNKLVGDIAQGLKMRFPNANIQLDIPGDLPPLQGDRPGITAIFQNLLENAMKYSPEGSPVQVSIHRKEHRTHIQISDKGAGIPAEEKGKVFEKFYRIGNEETRKSTGTGLGLYIVKQVVQGHGGSIQIIDNTPSGAVFQITI